MKIDISYFEVAVRTVTASPTTIWLASIFGRKQTSVDESTGATVKTAYWRGKIYLLEYIAPGEERE